MPLATIAFGLILLVASLATYAAADAPDNKALLPAFLGLLVLACGVASLIKKDLRMHLMHAAVLLALVGVIVPLWPLYKFLAKNLEGDEGLRNIGIIVTMFASALYIYAAVQSFVAARRKRKIAKAGGDADPA